MPVPVAISESTINAFFASSDRFVSRRGVCSNIYSDRGTNFVDAKHYLPDLYNLLKNNRTYHQTELSKAHESWKVNPPAGQYFSVLSEAGIRSAKSEQRVIRL